MRGLTNERGPKAARSHTSLVHRSRRLQDRVCLGGLFPDPNTDEKMGNKYSPSHFPFPFPVSKTECPNLEFRAPAMIPTYCTLLPAWIIPKEYSITYLRWLINAICPVPRNANRMNTMGSNTTAGGLCRSLSVPKALHTKLWAVLKR